MAIALDRIRIDAVSIGGFALSLSTWRLYGGRPWEALAWLAWVVAVVIVPGALGVVGFLALLLVGPGLLLADRLDRLPAVWASVARTRGDAGVMCTRSETEHNDAQCRP